MAILYAPIASEKLDQKREMVCPCCPTEHLLDHTHITPANTLVQKVLSNLTVICVECGGLVKASAMEKHADAKCQTHTMPISPSSVTVQYILHRHPLMKLHRLCINLPWQKRFEKNPYSLKIYTSCECSLLRFFCHTDG